jgi:hypothetical protein
MEGRVSADSVDEQPDRPIAKDVTAASATNDFFMTKS